MAKRCYAEKHHADQQPEDSPREADAQRKVLGSSSIESVVNRCQIGARLLDLNRHNNCSFHDGKLEAARTVDRAIFVFLRKRTGGVVEDRAAARKIFRIGIAQEVSLNPGLAHSWT